MNKIIYLDAAATYQKSDAVINAEMDFLKHNYANAGRGICARSAAVDDVVARARARVAAFMNARTDQIVWTHGATDALNMVADMIRMSAKTRVGVSDLDHHSARLPFVQKVIQRAGRVMLCPLDDAKNIDPDNIPVVDVLIVTAMSNVMGVAQDVAKIIKSARDKNPNVITVVDAAQFVVHEKIDVNAWNCDFACWSAHKIGADTGLGILYVKNPGDFMPVRFGGGMVNRIVDDKPIWNMPPDVFEAGTLPLTQIAGLIPAIDMIEKNRPDVNLIKFAYDELLQLPGIKILTGRDAAMLTFNIDGMHPIDVGALMGARDVCVRVGNMCASWIWGHMGCAGGVRMSIGGYNTMDDIKFAIAQIKDILKNNGNK